MIRVAGARKFATRGLSSGDGKHLTFRSGGPPKFDKPRLWMKLAQLVPAVKMTLEHRKNRSLHILVIQDHKPTDRVLTEMLEKHGYEVLGSNRGEEAIAIARFQLFDLIIADVSRADTDEWKLLTDLLKLQPQARTIAISDKAGESDVNRSRKSGFKLHFSRPIEGVVLLSAIGTLCSA